FKKISYFIYFFFQAEDGIRDKLVTGVQTCALPIFRKILEKAGVAPGGDGRVNPELFESPAERELHSGATAAATKVQTLKRGGKYQEALEVIAGLRPVVDRFFDGVMVMADREEVRKNRLALLANLLGEFTTIADFSEIGGEERAGAS